MTESTMQPRDKWIPWYFVAFFAVIAILDSIFVYTAITTQTGVVTEKPYEKGIAFNETLNKANAQPKINDRITFQNGILKWNLDSIKNATVKVQFVRPVQDGYDFTETMRYDNNHYQIKPQFPLPGHWVAKLSATWDNQNYHKTYPIITE